MSDIHFSNYRLEEGTDYFLYIGELKNYGLNTYLREALSRIHNRPFDFIAIVPDVFEQYNYDNLLVINPLAATLQCKYGAGGKIPLHRSNVVGPDKGDVILKKPWNGQEVKYPAGIRMCMVTGGFRSANNRNSRLPALKSGMIKG